MENPGVVLTRTLIIEQLWDYEYDGMSNVVDRYVGYLRRKIDRPFAQDDVQTVRGVGYLLKAPVSRYADPGPSCHCHHDSTALAAAFGGLIFVTTLGHRLHNSLVAELTARADAVSQQLQQAPQITSSPPGGPPDLSDSRSVTQVLDRNETLVASAGLDQGMGLLDRSTLAAAARGPIVRERLLSGIGVPSLLLAQPASDGKPYVVVVGTSLATVDSAVGQVRTVIIIGGAVVVLLAGVATWLLAGAARSPVERMRRQAAAMTGVDEASSLEVPETHDEIAALASTFNDLLARIHMTLQLQRSFVGAAGHELRTPLAILKTELELAGNPGRR